MTRIVWLRAMVKSSPWAIDPLRRSMSLVESSPVFPGNVNSCLAAQRAGIDTENVEEIKERADLDVRHGILRSSTTRVSD